ncbi:hypothetical protein K493DRAFT_393003 [Basidiobolus meristosporus CBS 931.73]|uniref:Carbohydrate-binding module family 19 domain-containing protein n=1 Tax=Basidiobolus meristosporus CBS 931.73 TaxID=1314790 RepID=A0A1Y1WTM6_9FUNG|nr:hypothetical protein K493DRAFT_393003 [Basidiobolus meristosporus CBS 931.73]|eukprot:ORX76900.1 hypothetical protein K493DRAFT_393003 [Basidiobolus meristosporus CBS 931.73]
MKFSASISAGLTLAAAVSALPLNLLQQQCQEGQNTALKCLDERQSGVMYRCANGKVVDYACPGGQVCVMFTFGGSTSAACAERPPAPVNTPKTLTQTEASSTKVVSTTTSHVESTSVHTATPKPAVHAPCECSSIDETSPVYMNDFLLAFQNNGYFWDVASRSQESEHRFEYKGLNAEGKNFTAITTIQPNEPVVGGLSISAKLYECFMNSEKTPGWNSNALIAPKCALYADNKLIASMELTASHIKAASTKAVPTTTSHVESSTVHVVPTATPVKPAPTSIVQTSAHVKSVSTKAETTSTITSAHETPSAAPKPAPIDASTPILMGDFIMDYHNTGYLWNSAARSKEYAHQYEYQGWNDMGVGYTAKITIQPNEPVEGDVPLSTKFYECFKSTETTPSWSYNALIAPKCSLYADNKLLASMEFTASQ